MRKTNILGHGTKIAYNCYLSSRFDTDTGGILLQYPGNITKLVGWIIIWIQDFSTLLKRDGVGACALAVLLVTNKTRSEYFITKYVSWTFEHFRHQFFYTFRGPWHQNCIWLLSIKHIRKILMIFSFVCTAWYGAIWHEICYHTSCRMIDRYTCVSICAVFVGSCTRHLQEYA